MSAPRLCKDDVCRALALQLRQTERLPQSSSQPVLRDQYPYFLYATLQLPLEHVLWAMRYLPTHTSESCSDKGWVRKGRRSNVDISSAGSSTGLP